MDSKKPSKESGVTRRLYVKPDFRIYGQISAITQTLANNNMADGPLGGNMDKTS